MSVTTAKETIELDSVNVSQPEVIGQRRGKPVLSGIGKRPVGISTIHVGETNLEGDRQADLRFHGGPDKAVYVYPSEHLALWSQELMRETPFAPGTFGENLTTAGWLEDEVLIGDIWAWGEALLQVAQPRYPCFKLGIATGRPDVVKRMVANGRTGWYLRVLRTGFAPVAGPIVLAERGGAGVTVRAAHLARLPGAATAQVDGVLSEPALAATLRRDLSQTKE